MILTPAQLQRYASDAVVHARVRCTPPVAVIVRRQGRTDRSDIRPWHVVGKPVCRGYRCNRLVDNFF